MGRCYEGGGLDGIWDHSDEGQCHIMPTIENGFRIIAF